MDIVEILPIVTAVLTVVSALAGKKYREWKSKAVTLQKLISEINEAIKDDELSEEELDRIKKYADRLVS